MSEGRAATVCSVRSEERADRSRHTNLRCGLGALPHPETQSRIHMISLLAAKPNVRRDQATSRSHKLQSALLFFPSKFSHDTHSLSESATQGIFGMSYPCSIREHTSNTLRQATSLTTSHFHISSTLPLSMAPKDKAEGQTFSFQEVACMVAAMNAGGVVLGAKHYGLMAKLDGERSTSSFEHKFRAVKARGKELATELNDDCAVPKTPRSAKTTTTSTGKKRGSMFLAFPISCSPN